MYDARVGSLGCIDPIGRRMASRGDPAWANTLAGDAAPARAAPPAPITNSRRSSLRMTFSLWCFESAEKELVKSEFSAKHMLPSVDDRGPQKSARDVIVHLSASRAETAPHRGERSGASPPG